jgi:iron complex outermembrane receptor protein
VITYRDGIPTFPGYFQDEPYYDISNLEILRGPQGTFVGQNATGGPVFITETNPSLEGVHGYLAGQYGNYKTVEPRTPRTWMEPANLSQRSSTRSMSRSGHRRSI